MKVILALALWFVAAPAATETAYATMSERGRTGFWDVAFFLDGRQQWKDIAAAQFVAVYAKRRLVVYSAIPAGALVSLIGRTYQGREVWRSAVGEHVIWPVAGGHSLLCLLPGAQPGIMVEDVRNWAAIMRATPVLAFDLRSRRCLWRSSLKAIGRPVWTNGEVFFSVSVGTSRAAVRSVSRGRARLPIVLEQRRVTDRKLLWRRKLRGYPPGLTTATAGTGNSVRLVFSRRRDVPFSESDDILRFLDRLIVTAPVLRGRVDRASERPRVYRLPYR